MLLISGEKLATVLVAHSWIRGDVYRSLQPVLPDGQAVRQLLVGHRILQRGLTVKQLGLESGAVLTAVLAARPICLGKYKCWWSDVKEVFDIEKTESGCPLVTVYEDVD